jgi:hypothetical protein
VDKIDLTTLIGYVVGIVYMLLRARQTKNQTEELKTSQQNAANSTRIVLKEEESITRAEVRKILGEHDDKVVAERASHTEALNELRKNDEKIIHYLRRVCAVNGIEWKDEITIVKEPKGD